MSSVNPEDPHQKDSPQEDPQREDLPPVEPESVSPREAEVPERLSFTSPPALMTSVFLSGVTLMFSLYGWYAIGPDIRSQVSWSQGATLLLIVFIMIAIMLSVGYSRLWADEKGVTVRNGPVLRKFTVDQIAGLRLRSGDAWAYLLIKDNGAIRRRAVLSIQSLEGARGKRKLRELRAWLKANGATSQGYTLGED